MSAKVLPFPTPARRAAAGRLRRARVALGWSQERAARELGIGVRTLRDLELGRARMTAIEALCVLEQRFQAAA
jgi:transcriptional regulator with XRE-family HTH domain